MIKPEQSKLTFAALIILWAIYLLVVPGCATQKKAEKYYKKHPVELAKVCAEKYPVKDSIIKGDSVTVYDTLWGLETRVDTVTITPNVVTKIVEKTVPKLITKLVTVHDTIVRENTAKTAVLNSQIAKSARDIRILTEKTHELSQERDTFKHERDKARLINWILYVVIGLTIGYSIKRKFKLF
jgi:hypothetical protein